MFSLKVNGQELGNLMIINNIDFGFAPDMSVTSRKYALVDGERFVRRRFGKRIIKVKFTILGDRIKKSKIAIQRALLVPGISKFEFGYQPDVYYEGVVSGTNDFNLITFRYAQGSFEIHCFNPFAISKAEKAARRESNKLIFNNEGTAPVYPIYKFTAERAYKMISFTHPNGKVVQYGYENGPAVINTNDLVVFDSAENKLTINGERKYINAASQVFSIQPGLTEVAILGDENKIPVVEATFKERWI